MSNSVAQVRVNKASAHQKNLDVGANIFIGNLDPEVDEKLLYDTFSAFGVILTTPKIQRDPETGNSKGFAFINYASFEASDAAIEAMNGQYLCNRCPNIKVCDILGCWTMDMIISVLVSGQLQYHMRSRRTAKGKDTAQPQRDFLPRRIRYPRFSNPQFYHLLVSYYVRRLTDLINCLLTLLLWLCLQLQGHSLLCHLLRE